MLMSTSEKFSCLDLFLRFILVEIEGRGLVEVKEIMKIVFLQESRGKAGLYSRRIRRKICIQGDYRED